MNSNNYKESLRKAQAAWDNAEDGRVPCDCECYTRDNPVEGCPCQCHNGVSTN